MGYAGCIDAILAICVHFHHMSRAMKELKKTGDYKGMTNAECVAARKGVEDLIGLDDYYAIERATVEKAYSGSRSPRVTQTGATVYSKTICSFALTGLPHMSTRGGSLRALK